MGANLDRILDCFEFNAEGRIRFLNNLKGLAKKAIEENNLFDFHPLYFWKDDLSGWSAEDRERLLTWLYTEAKIAAIDATADYDYSVAPKDLDELEEEVVEMEYAAAIRRVLQLQERYRLAIVKTDGKGQPILVYLDGRKEYISR